MAKQLERTRPSEARHLYLRIAEERDDPRAWFGAGQCCCLLDDWHRGAEFFKQAAQKGVKEAAHALGSLYSDNKRRMVDYEQALEWYSLGAQLGGSISATRAGDLHFEGKSDTQGERDVGQAEEFWWQAVHLEEEPEALNKLGNLYCTEEFGRKDAVKSLSCFVRAARKAVEWQLKLPKYHDLYDKLISSALQGISTVVDDVEALARSDTEACFWLGEVHSIGLTVPLDLEAAVMWYLLAVPHPLACFRLHNHYLAGSGGVSPSETRALELLRLAAEGGIADAQLELARQLAAESDEGQSEVDEMIGWLRLAAEQGCIASQRELALCLDESAGADKEHEAEHWWLSAASGGDAASTLTVARRCRDSGDFIEAARWYLRLYALEEDPAVVEELRGLLSQLTVGDLLKANDLAGQDGSVVAPLIDECGVEKRESPPRP